MEKRLLPVKQEETKSLLSDEDIMRIGAKWLTANGSSGRAITFLYAYKLALSTRQVKEVTDNEDIFELKTYNLKILQEKVQIPH